MPQLVLRARDLAGLEASVGVDILVAQPPVGPELFPGGNVDAFIESLEPGETGYLRGGVHTAGVSVTWSKPGLPDQPIILAGYPGEQAILQSELVLDGDYQIVRDFEISDLFDPGGGGTSGYSGVRVSAAHCRIEHMRIRNTSRHGIITHSDASDATIVRNYISDIGTVGETLEHGIYMQVDGLVANNVFANVRGGYGIHLYSHPSNVIVAHNTSVGSQTRAGILVDTTAGNITVVNNIFAFNGTTGINFRRCDAGGCLVDNNLCFGNAQSQVGGTLAALATNTIQADPLFADAEYRVQAGSAAVGAARPDYAFSPDRDGVARPVGAAADLGAYER